MTRSTRWERMNDRYLANALTWLRVRLERLAEQDASRGRRPKAFRGDAWAPQFRKAAAAMAEAEKADPPPAMAAIARRFGMSRFERDLLLLCAGMELDTRVPALCARAHGNPGRTWPTFSLALALFDDPAWDALSPERPLRYWRLIEIHQPAAQPLTASALRADERIVNAIKGLTYLDDRLAPLVMPLGRVDAEDRLPPSQQAAAGRILERLRQTDGGLPIVHLLGPDGASKQGVARHAAAALGLGLYRLPADLVPQPASELETVARLWHRESALSPVALYLDALELEKAGGGEGQSAAVQRFLSRSPGLVFLDTREAWAGWSLPVLAIDVAKPEPAEQRTAWAAVLGRGEADAGARRLAGQFDLDLSAIRRIAAAEGDGDSDPGDRVERLWEVCLVQTRPKLDALAQRIEPRAGWDDLVLPAAETEMLRRIGGQVAQRSRVYDDWGFRRRMSRGLGISALFSGESGTGKTMAAEVLAGELRLNLYRIDLSAVVSKYIGETEKNLRRLFDLAEDGGAILFFDEADALFGKRSEVKDSHDRYANIEINYLLQRMEGYRGLAILATNMKSALDQAFMRRLRFVVHFPFPSAAERKAIWKKVFPRETPAVRLDWDRLARLPLTGGSIHTIALNAAFRAAEMKVPVTMPVVLEAARTEYRKLEKPVNEAEFKWQEPAAQADLESGWGYGFASRA